MAVPALSIELSRMPTPSGSDSTGSSTAAAGGIIGLIVKLLSG
jgi:hypothetical protein